MWILAVLSASLLVLAALLFVPVDLGFRVTREDRSRGEISVGWLFDLLRKQIEVGRGGQGGKPDARKSKQAESRTRRRRAAKPLLRLARTRGFPHRCLRLLRRLVRQVKFRELVLEGRVGFDDPADTGFLFAALTPALSCFAPSPTVSVSLEPDFEQASLAGRASGAVRLVPAQILWSFLLFLLSPEALRAVWSLATERGR